MLSLTGYAKRETGEAGGGRIVQGLADHGRESGNT